MRNCIKRNQCLVIKFGTSMRSPKGILFIFFFIRDALKAMHRFNPDRRKRYDRIDHLNLSISPPEHEGGVLILNRTRSKHIYLPPIEDWLRKQQDSFPNTHWDFGYLLKEVVAPTGEYVYNENSLCISLSGIDTQELLSIAAEFIKFMHIDEVLTFDNTSKVCYIVDVSPFRTNKKIINI